MKPKPQQNWARIRSPDVLFPAWCNVVPEGSVSWMWVRMDGDFVGTAACFFLITCVRPAVGFVGKDCCF